MTSCSVSPAWDATKAISSPNSPPYQTGILKTLFSPPDT